MHRLSLKATLVAGIVTPLSLLSSGSSAAPLEAFVEAVDTGLSFTHVNGMTGDYQFPEMTGQGGAFLDYDNDGDLDV
ncbi:MAG: hypothetical protein KDD47_10550, partial [Acidobacteria bacterium]|nr:hypothetical protein [Acidobacteriota bacterium]